MATDTHVHHGSEIAHDIPKGTPHNPLGIKGVDHIEFLVDDAEAWASYHERSLGMRRRAYADPASGVKGRRAFLVGQGRINFLFAQPSGAGPEADFIRQHHAKHGNGVRDIAFRVQDIRVAFDHAIAQGVRIVRPIDDHEDFTAFSFATYGDTIHTMIQRKRHDRFAPGYINLPGGMEDDDIQLMMIDHIVANVEHMDEWCNYYARVFGFNEARHFDINTGRSALMSKVMGDKDGYIKMPINEPSSKNSQIQEFLDEYRGPGVQHIALLTSNIVAAVRTMRQRGMDFLEVPGTYYDALPGRVGEIQEKADDVRNLGILVDRDRADGYLLQLFSKPIFDRPTLFYEVIQRRGNSDGFGEGNFTALFEAIEREQAKRGRL
jgi:4-hydroxyphenylpyruvate dioxygenase